MSTPEITVYTCLMSQPARSILVLLKHHKCLDKVKVVNIELMKGEHKTPEFAAINPYQTVPVLTYGDLKIFESPAIIQFFAEHFQWTGDYGMPVDTIGKYKVITSLHSHHNTVRTPFLNIMGSYYGCLLHGAPFNLEAQIAALEKAKATFGIIEGILTQNGGFLNGSTPSVADAHAFIEFFQLTKGDFPSTDYQTLHVYDFDDFPAMKKWIATIKDTLYVPNAELWGPVTGLITAAGAKMNNEFRLLDKQ